MTFEDLLKLTRRQVVAIAVGLLAGLFVALTVILLTPVSYQASAEAYIRVNVSPDGEAAQQYAASQLANQKVKAFVPVFTSEAVAQGVIDSLGLDMTPAQLSRSLSATNKNNTLTITVTATASSEDRARRIADEVVRQSAEQVKQLEGEDSPIEVVLMSPSALAPTTRSPSGFKYLGVGLVGGVLLG